MFIYQSAGRFCKLKLMMAETLRDTQPEEDQVWACEALWWRVFI